MYYYYDYLLILMENNKSIIAEEEKKNKHISEDIMCDSNTNLFKLFSKISEQNVLNIMFYNDKSCYEAIDVLQEDDFFFEIHQNIFNSIKEFVINSYSKRDIFLFIEFIKKKYNNNLKMVGNLDYLFSLFNVLTDHTYYHKYLEIVINKSKIRKLNQLSYKIINAIKFDKKDLDLEVLEEDLLNVFSRRKNTDLGLIQNFTSLVGQEVGKILNKDYRHFLSSGFSNLDSAIIGFFESELTVIAGRPGTGKTAFALNLALNIIKQNKVVVFVNLEMTNTQMFQRIVSLNSGVSIYLIRSNEITEKEMLNIKEQIEQQSHFQKLFVIDAPGISIKKIKFILHYLLLEQKKIDILILDYLQLLVSHNKLSKHEDLTNITIDLKNIGRHFSIPIIALSQLSRESTKADKPGIQHLKYSGGIEENFDNIFMLHEINKTTTKQFDIEFKTEMFSRERMIELIIGKQRNGPLGSVFFNFKVSHGKFIESKTL